MGKSIWKNLRIFCNNVTRTLSSDCDTVKMGLKDKFEEDKTANQSGLDVDLKLRGYRNDIIKMLYRTYKRNQLRF